MKKQDSIKVAIVDDHDLVRKSLEILLKESENIQLLASFENGSAFMNYLDDRQTIPDVVLLDINMPVMDGFETMRTVVDKNYPCKVMVLTLDEEEDSILKMLQLGAKGYLLKNLKLEELTQAIYHVHHYGFYSNELISRALMGSVKQEKKFNLDNLTKREKEFLKWVCTDLTYKEIAEKMFLSPKTVDTYRDSVFQKFNAKNRIGLVLGILNDDILSQL